MFKAAATPPKIVGSILGPELPLQRTADVPGIVALEVKNLFPEIPEKIYLPGDDLTAIRQATEEALAGVDMGMIKPDDKVNLLCSEHGFSILEGEPYAEMLKTIKDVVEARTGCRNLRLRFCVGGGMIEAREMIPHYKLDEYFEGRVKATGPLDRGVAIETEIGTLYGLARVFDSDWIIHAHYDDPREVYFHRLIYRTLKAFTMSYARFETRSVYHMNFGPRSSNIVPRAIFDSPFVQEKFAFVASLVTSPAGITGVDADNDLYDLDRRLTANLLRSFGKLMRLFAEIDECIAVLEAGRWPWYHHAGGLTSGNLFKGHIDYLDLDVGPARKKGGVLYNQAVKALVINYSWREFFQGLAFWYPLIITNRKLAQGLPYRLVSRATVTDNVPEALDQARRIAGTDKIIVFDGSYGWINLSPSLGEFFLAKAPAVGRRVEEELLPKWLRQRGIDPDMV